LFTVRVLGYLSFGYTSGFFSEHRLRTEALRGLFASAHSRRFWDQARINWLIPGNSHDARFARIVDEEHRKAVASGPPVEPAVSADIRKPPEQAKRSHGAAAAVIAGILLVGWAAARRRR
jgi:hypothetical protein